jgi:hypothetical protein
VQFRWLLTIKVCEKSEGGQHGLGRRRAFKLNGTQQGREKPANLGVVAAQLIFEGLTFGMNEGLHLGDRCRERFGGLLSEDQRAKVGIGMLAIEHNLTGRLKAECGCIQIVERAQPGLLTTSLTFREEVGDDLAEDVDGVVMRGCFKLCGKCQQRRKAAGILEPLDGWGACTHGVACQGFEATRRNRRAGKSSDAECLYLGEPVERTHESDRQQMGRALPEPIQGRLAATWRNNHQDFESRLLLWRDGRCQHTLEAFECALLDMGHQPLHGGAPGSSTLCYISQAMAWSNKVVGRS